MTHDDLCLLADKWLKKQNCGFVFTDKFNRSFKDKLFGKNKMSDSNDCLLFFKGIFEKESKITDIKIES